MDRKSYIMERKAHFEAEYERRQSANKDTVIGRLNAEITQLRADLEQERELVDRLYSAIEYIDDYCLAYPELETVSAVSSSAIDYVDTRRNK